MPPESPRVFVVKGRMGASASNGHAFDLVVVGGCGHVGLPLALAFARVGCKVGIFDTDRDKVAHVSRGRMPFSDHGADRLLTDLLPTGRLHLSHEPEFLAQTSTVLLVLGTPIDEFMNPSMSVFKRVVEDLTPKLNDGTLVVLRSTVYPGTTEYVADRMAELGRQVDVVFCPERIAEGHALEEIHSLPQIIGAGSDRAFERASELFGKLDVEVVRTGPKEAELAKLLTNTWRYMKFAIANQFFQIAHRAGADYGEVLHAIRHNYPRAADLPSPGFAAGPCLLKDTMQLAAFSPDHFPMGHAAMLINEGLPGYIVEVLDARRPLAGRTLGILGMAFKGDSDDTRASLSFKLKKLAEFKGARVLCTDPHVKDGDLQPLEEVVSRSDVLVVGAPHSAYRGLNVDGKELVDVWGVTGRGIDL